MLRGAQTAGELKGRSERLHAFASPAEVEETLERLAERELVRKLDRRPGEKGNRWEHLLGTEADAVADADADAPTSSLEERVAALEARLEELERQLGA
jgi:uncharacterized protein YceH (UPF0502 family)